MPQDKQCESSQYVGFSTYTERGRQRLVPGLVIDRFIFYKGSVIVELPDAVVADWLNRLKSETSKASIESSYTGRYHSNIHTEAFARYGIPDNGAVVVTAAPDLTVYLWLHDGAYRLIGATIE